MIRFHPPSLKPDSLRVLSDLQADVDGEPDYPARVARAKKEWEGKLSKNEKREAFDDVKQKMRAALPGPQRCCYCEDSAADEIEHTAPKDWFPERCFDWDNYLYACGPCNGPKSNRWAVIPPGATACTEATRVKGGPVVPPPPRQAALIDPRQEEPLGLLWLDLATGELLEAEAPGSARFLRAEYTIEVLSLNAREYLRRQRRHAFSSFLNDLREYRDAKGAGDAAAMTDIEVRIKERAHRTVWEEMKRQYRGYRIDLARDRKGREIIALFDALSEALGW